MRITFVLNQVGQCGGVSNVLHIAKELVKRKHKVFVRYPYASGFHLGNLLRGIGFLGEKKIGWIDTKGIDVKCVPSLQERYIPDGDAVIATWWETAWYVKDYSDDIGEKFYYVQHDESLWGGPRREVEDTYFYDNLRILVNSRWTGKQLESKGAYVEGIVYPGISEQFYPLEKKKSAAVWLGVAYRDQHWKGWNDITSVLRYLPYSKKVKGNWKAFNFKLCLYGHRSPPSFDCIYYESPSDEELNRIYNNFTIFLNASHYEGFGMTPLEAMRCKTPVCTTRVGVFQDFKDTGAFVSESRDPAALAKNVLHVLENDVSKNVERAYEFARQFTFEKSAAAMEGALLL